MIIYLSLSIILSSLIENKKGKHFSGSSEELKSSFGLFLKIKK